jgi:hypothetical protein
MQRDLRRIGINVPGGKQNFPQGLKPAFLLALDGMAEAVPFPTYPYALLF